MGAFVWTYPVARTAVVQYQAALRAAGFTSDSTSVIVPVAHGSFAYGYKPPPSYTPRLSGGVFPVHLLIVGYDTATGITDVFWN